MKKNSTKAQQISLTDTIPPLQTFESVNKMSLDL